MCHLSLIIHALEMHFYLGIYDDNPYFTELFNRNQLQIFFLIFQRLSKSALFKNSSNTFLKLLVYFPNISFRKNFSKCIYICMYNLFFLDDSYLLTKVLLNN